MFTAKTAIGLPNGVHHRTALLTEPPELDRGRPRRPEVWYSDVHSAQGFNLDFGGGEGLLMGFGLELGRRGRLCGLWKLFFELSGRMVGPTEMGLEQWVPWQESAGSDPNGVGRRAPEGRAPGCARVEGGSSGTVGDATRAAVLGGRGNDRTAVALGRRRSLVRLRRWRGASSTHAVRFFEISESDTGIAGAVMNDAVMNDGRRSDGRKITWVKKM
uniref:Uncharacterized protein n=1 Tax=Oryza rufipogon TaxID=4529 RepID=A0A0E0QWH7_ORYRU